MLILGNVGQDSQLDLAIVRIHQNTALPGHEHLADLSTQIRTHGNILDIGICGGQAAGGRHQILESGVDPAILTDHLHQAIGIGGLQLGQHPVVHDSRDNGVLALQLFQHIRIGGIAGLGFLHRRQPQLVKEKLA